MQGSRSFIALIAVAIAALGLVGCAGSASKRTPEPVPASAAPPPPPPLPAPVKVQAPESYDTAPPTSAGAPQPVLASPLPPDQVLGSAAPTSPSYKLKNPSLKAPASEITDAPETADIPVKLEKYVARLSATKNLSIPGPPGELTVWIGAASFLPKDDVGMESSTVYIREKGSTALVTPIKDRVAIDSEKKCGRISPYGSIFTFGFQPDSQGTYEVGASIALFDSLDCSGTPVPKSAQSISVQVHVDYPHLLRDG